MYIKYIKAINKNIIHIILGFSLIEVMISALILSISLLGAASLQSKGLFSIIESGRQETATQMVNQLTTFALTADATNIANNSPPANLKYMMHQTIMTDQTISPTNANITKCYSTSPPTPTSGCSEQDFYIATVLEWRSILPTLLPNGNGCTCLVRPTGFTTSNSPQPVTIRVAVNWKNISNRISTVSIDTQVPSAVISLLSDLVLCASSSTPPQFNISNSVAQICNSYV